MNQSISIFNFNRNQICKIKRRKTGTGGKPLKINFAEPEPKPKPERYFKRFDALKISERRLQSLLVCEIIDRKLGFSTLLQGQRKGHGSVPPCGRLWREENFPH